MRFLGWICAGLMAGIMIHLIIILTLPRFVDQTNWLRIGEMAALEVPAILPVPLAGDDNPFRLDSEFAYVACRHDLARGPAVVSGLLPDGFWSVSVFDAQDHSIYGTTNRSGSGQVLQLGIFNAAQTRLLAQQELEITEGLLIVESPSDDVYVVVRLALPYPAMRARYERALSALSCAHVDGGDDISPPSDP